MVRLFHVYFPSRTVFLVLSETLLVLVAAIVGVAFVLRFQDLELALVYERGILKMALASAVLILCMYYYDLYDSVGLRRPAEVLTRLVQVLGTTSVILAGLYYAFPEIQPGRGPFLMWIAFAGVVLAVWRYLFRMLNKTPRLSDRTLLLGASPVAIALSSEIESRPELGLALVGYLETAPPVAQRVNGLACLGTIEELPAVVERQHVNRVILTMSDRRGHLPVDTLLSLKARGLIIQDAPDVYEAVTGKIRLDSLHPSWLLFSDGFWVSRLTLTYKRIVSIVLSVMGILAAAPLMILAALAIRLDSPGPAIFRQKRVGRDGRIFTIFKFRSMRENADGDGKPRPAMEDDDRITRVGHWLRRLRVDELPQLFNILRGDMYFIGPRPFVPDTEAELAERIPFYKQRWIVKPGATGWAQVNRGYCASLEDNADKLSYDLFYIKNMSIGLDCLILFQTLKIMLLGRGSR